MEDSVMFNDDSFLLKSEKAKELYELIRDMPILDYHCHLSPKEIYENKTFYNLTELWLEADHYKWRVMRNAGIDEKYITGDADPYEKFLQFASIMPDFIGNPVYHWAHIELKQYFDIDTPLSRNSAPVIWEDTMEMMKEGGFCARNLIIQSKVKVIVTTDDPIDKLDYHELLATEDIPFKVLPCFRLDRVLGIQKEDFASYIGKLGNAAGMRIADLSELITAIERRLEFFIAHGCVAIDLSFADFPKAEGDLEIADVAFKKAIAGEELTCEERKEYVFVMLCEIARMCRTNNLVMQIHAGVLRNQNKVRFAQLGPDTGIDSLGNTLDIVAAGKLFNKIEENSGTPKTIVYTLNPTSYYTLATMLGDFAGEIRGKMQLGAAWWFMDHRDGIKEQLKIFANTSGLGLFNGMLTDSRSFTSYARHDYFRRILCSLIGEWVEKGEYPDDEDMLNRLLKDICYYNAEKYFLGGHKI